MPALVCVLSPSSELRPPTSDLRVFRARPRPYLQDVIVVATAELRLIPSIDAGVQHLAGQLAAAKAQDPLMPAQVLVPTTDVARYLRSRLGNTLAVHLWEFYGLSRAILDEAGSPVYELRDAAIRRLVRSLLSSMHRSGQLTTFYPVWDKPGFLQVMIEWLREVKTQGIPPEEVEADAIRSGQERDRQLALLYRRYQDFMHRQDCSDADGLLWLAAVALEGDPGLFQERGPFLVLGFDQFNRIQRRILGQLAARLAPFAVYLQWDEDRSGDSLALARLAQTRDDLLADLRPPRVSLIPEWQPSVPAQATARYVPAADDPRLPLRPPALDHLHRTLFEITSRDTAAVDVPRLTGDDAQALRLVAAPSQEAEVRWALRRAKELLLQGAHPQEIALLAVDPDVYGPMVRAVAHEVGVPVSTPNRLKDNPAVIALLNLLQLWPRFPWRETFDALRSPYAGHAWLGDEQLDLLDQLTRQRPVVAGQSQWQFALTPAEISVKGEVDEELGEPPLVATLPPEELSAIATGLQAFFDYLRPPETASYRDHALWLQGTLLGLHIEPDEGSPQNLAAEAEQENCAESPPRRPPAGIDLLACSQEGPFAQRDLQALGQLLRVLGQLVEAASLVPGAGDGDDGIITWEVFRRELMAQVEAALLPADQLQAAIRFGPLEAGRALPVDHLLVLGLAEGELPKPPPPDPLYAPVEREAHPLPLLRRRQADDASLWWQVLGNCRLSLALLRPRFDDKGAAWLPSPYWNAVADCFPGLEPEELPAGGMPHPAQCASPGELLVSLAHAGVASVPDELNGPWQVAQRALEVIRRRQGWQPLSTHEGILSASDLLAELNRRFGPEHSWSASRLNRYGNCPYGFFVETVLQLKARPDPEEGMDAAQRGSLLHQALEDLYRSLARQGLAPTSLNQAQVLAELDQCCDALFPSAPLRYGFRPNALWRYEQAELRRQLRALITWECQQNGESAQFRPYLQELRFGLPGGHLPDATVVDVDGFAYRLHGVVDRIGRDEAGRLRVIDYKSGSSRHSKADIARGLSLQSALYALAVDRLLGQDHQVVQSAYLSIPKRELSGRLDFPENGVDADETAQAAVAQSAAFVRSVQSGQFPSLPARPTRGGTACRTTCDLAPLCRVTWRAIRKAQSNVEREV